MKMKMKRVEVDLVMLLPPLIFVGKREYLLFQLCEWLLWMQVYIRFEFFWFVEAMGIGLKELVVMMHEDMGIGDASFACFKLG